MREQCLVFFFILARRRGGGYGSQSLSFLPLRNFYCPAHLCSQCNRAVIDNAFHIHAAARGIRQRALSSYAGTISGLCLCWLDHLRRAWRTALLADSPRLAK